MFLPSTVFILSFFPPHEHRDKELINLELALANLAQVEKRIERARKEVKSAKNNPSEEYALEKVEKVLLNNEPARNAILNEEEVLAIKSLGSLTRKKMIYAANVQDSQLGSVNEMVENLKVMVPADGS